LRLGHGVRIFETRFEITASMAKLSSRRVLIAGFLSPIAAFFCYVLVYLILERISSDLEKSAQESLKKSATFTTL